MTLPNKDSRKIVVDNNKFRYLVKGHNGFIKFIVELEGKGNKKFTANFDYKVSKKLLSTLKNIDYREGDVFIITPKVVREIIEFGINKGWLPMEKGGEYFYDFSSNFMD